MKLRPAMLTIIALYSLVFSLPAYANPIFAGLHDSFSFVAREGGSQGHVRVPAPDDDFPTNGASHDRRFEHDRDNRDFVLPESGEDPLWWGSPLYPGDPYTPGPQLPEVNCQSSRAYYDSANSCPEKERVAPNPEPHAGTDR